jgi:hypothetical protein
MNQLTDRLAMIIRSTTKRIYYPIPFSFLVESGLGVSLVPACALGLEQQKTIRRPLAAKSNPICLCATWPGRVLAENETPPAALLGMVAAQLQVQSALWDEYAQRDETRREHLIELQHLYGFQPFTSRKYREIAQALIPLADQTHQAMVLVRSVIDQLRSTQVIIPPLSVIERLCAEAITRAERRLYRKLTSGLDEFQRTALDNVLGTRLNTKQSMLAWKNAGICSWLSIGSCNTTSTLTINTGAECSCASAPICLFRHESASMNITG